MVWMKRLIIGCVLVLLFLVGLIAGFFWYRAVNQTAINLPEDTQSIMRVEVDRLFWELLPEMLGDAFTDQRTGDSVSDFGLRDWWQIARSVPAVCYFYSLADQPDRYYSHFSVRNSRTMDRFLVEKLKLQRDSSASMCVYRQRFAQVIIQGNDMHVLLGRGLDDMALDTLVESAKTADDQLRSTEDFLSAHEVVKFEDLMYFDRNGNQMGLDFGSGMVEFQGRMSASFLNIPEHSKAGQFLDDDVFYGYLNTDLRKLLPIVQKHVEQFDVSEDQLTPYLGNFLDFRIGNETVSQTDTIVTYEYDENFQQTETLTTQTLQVPELSVRLAASPHLLAHLPDKLFYTFQKSHNGGLIQLSTMDSAIVNLPSGSSYPFQLFYRRGDSSRHFESMSYKVLDAVQSVNIQGKRGGVSTLDLHGEIVLGASSTHALLTLLNGGR